MGWGEGSSGCRLLRAFLITLVATVAAPLTIHAQGIRDVRGTVLARRDSTPMGGVLVQAPAREIMVMTDARGLFVLRRVPRESLMLTFTRLGVQPDTAWLDPDEDEIRVYLREIPIALPPLTTEVVPEARLRFDSTVQPSVVSIDRETITRLPALLEADVTRAVQLLPGTIALNDYTVGFNVRGGEPDQNLTQLDGITIFNPSHLGGLFSTFDADAVETVDFITGAFPAEYGGRLSSVLDVGVRPGRADRIGALGNISLLATKVLLEGPIGRTGLTFLAGGRRTYADFLVGALSDETMPYHFADAVGKLSMPIGRGGSLSLTGYWGEDAIDWTWIKERPGQDAVILQADWGNRLLGLHLRQPLGRHQLSLDAGVTAFALRFGFEPGIFDATNTVRLLSTRATLELHPHRAHVLRVGGGVEDFRMTYDVASESFGTEFFTATYQPRVWSLFADEQWRPFRWLMLRPGVRMEAVEGPRVVTLAPRVGAKVFLTSDLALTASVGRYHQAIHSLRDQNVPWNIFDFWIGADSVIPVARSDHVVLGLERWFGRRVSVSLEAYHKTFHDIIDANLNEDPRVQGDETLPVDGDASGIDLLVRKHWGRVTGWVAYGLNRTVRRSRGAEYPAVHDRRHTLNVVLQTRGPLGSDMSVRLGYGSPLPFTPFVGEWRHRSYRADANAFDDSRREPIASATLNSARYPYYGRMDVSFRWEKRKWGGVLRPYVQFVNVFNRKNVFVYTFDYSTAPATRTAVSQLPLLPSVGVEFVF